MPHTQRKEYTVNQAYPELLLGLCTLLKIVLKNKVHSKNWYNTFYNWFQEDLELWNTKKETGHHLLAFGGMASFNDLVPDPDFPGGKKEFEYFHDAYRLLKELSYLCAQIWYWYLNDHPERIGSEARIIFRGTPVTICTCPEEHRWMKEDINISYYTDHASNLSEMIQCLTLIQDKGGEKAVKWLLANKIIPEPQPVVSKMKDALYRAGIIPRPEGCKSCKGKKVMCVLQYLIGDPLELSTNHFRTEEVRR